MATVKTELVSGYPGGKYYITNKKMAEYTVNVNPSISLHNEELAIYNYSEEYVQKLDGCLYHREYYIIKDADPRENVYEGDWPIFQKREDGTWTFHRDYVDFVKKARAEFRGGGGLFFSSRHLRHKRVCAGRYALFYH